MNLKKKRNINLTAHTVNNITVCGKVPMSLTVSKKQENADDVHCPTIA